MDDRQEIKSLKKALRALTFLNCNGESTVTQVAGAIGVPRTTSYRLLETLASEGYVEKQPHSNIYRLTSMVQKLSSGFGDCDLLVEVAKPLVTRVGREIRWPMALATPLGGDMMVRVATDHDTPLAIDRYFIGFRVAMLHAPAGLCYLANCCDEEKASILDLIHRSSPSTCPQLDQGAELEFTLDRIRRMGFCHIRFPQYREGGLAVPLFANNKVVGGVVMRYMKSSIKAQKLEDDYAPILQDLASDISAAYSRRATQSAVDIEPYKPMTSMGAQIKVPLPFSVLDKSAASPLGGAGVVQRASR